MALIYEWGFFVKPDAVDALAAWLAENEDALAKAAPEGLEYLGTYSPVWAEEPRCHMYQVWRWRRANEFNLRLAAGADKSEFARLAAEFLTHVDDTRSHEESFRLHRSVVDRRRSHEQTEARA